MSGIRLVRPPSVQSTGSRDALGTPLKAVEEKDGDAKRPVRCVMCGCVLYDESVLLGVLFYVGESARCGV